MSGTQGVADKVLSTRQLLRRERVFHAIRKMRSQGTPASSVLRRPKLGSHYPCQVTHLPLTLALGDHLMSSSGHIQTETFIAAWNVSVCVCVCPQDSAVVTYLENCHKETAEGGQLRLNPWSTLASDCFSFKIQLLIVQT